MLLIGKVTGQSIDLNRDSDLKVRLLQVEITEGDTQEIQQVLFAGEDNAPPEGSIVYILQVSSAFKVVVGVDDGIEPSNVAGERKVYSSDGGVIKAFTHYKKNGNQEINGSGDFAVRFTALETAFNQLKSDFNGQVTTYNSHNHPTAPVGPVSTPSAPGSPSAADMSGSKIDSLEVPS